MRTLFAILLYLSVTNTGVSVETYQKAMGVSIEKLFQTNTVTGYQEIARQFEDIAVAEKTEWLPLYYAALANILVTHTGADDATKDTSLDRSQQFLDKAMAINSNESELFALQGFLYSSRINIDPIKRGIIYFSRTKAAFDKATELDPNNPRVYFLRAQMILHMPKFVGGGTTKALPYFKKAVEKYQIFRPKTPFSPAWGKEINADEMRKAVNQASK